MSQNNEIEIIECCICMEQIEEDKNKIITECKHIFHTSCLMTNVAHNGFCCPFCRTAMAEVPAEDSDDEFEDYEEEEEDVPNYNNHVLRGSRWLFQRAEGEEVDESDESEDDDDDDEDDEIEGETIPTAEHMTAKLIQEGITMEDLVKTILLIDHDEYENNASFVTRDSLLYGLMRRIISNYRPDVEVLVLQEEEEEPPCEAVHLFDAISVTSPAKLIAEIYESMFS